MKIQGAELLLRLLEENGVEIIVGIPGGANLPIYNALSKSRIRHILARHEQGAGFIAQGMARSTGKPAVCLATSGPGATNILTAIADAKLDSTPIIAITGQVPTSLLGTNAFQEVDTFGMTLPITKKNYIVRNIQDLPGIIKEAFFIATAGRPGPVVIDIPKDIQTAIIDIGEPQSIYNCQATNICRNFPNKNENTVIDGLSIELIKEIVDKINNSLRPILYIGGGIKHSNASGILYKFAKKNSIPVASSLIKLGAFPAFDELNLGMLGMHGAKYTNYILNEADLLLAFGVRFDDRATGNTDRFCFGASIIHIDIDNSEINKIKIADLSLNADIGNALHLIEPFLNIDDRRDWIEYISAMKKQYPLYASGFNTSSYKQPRYLIAKIAEFAGDDAIIVTDVGQHQMWVAQYYPFSRPRSFLTSGGLGTMGFGLPVAIGAALANPDKRVICFSGDGSMLMNIQELATLAELKLNVKIIIMNNGYLGLVRQQQELFYECNYIASQFDFNPDFSAIGAGFGIRSFDLWRSRSPEHSLKNAIIDNGPRLINAAVNYYENVYPIVPPGAPNCYMIG